MYKGLSRLFAIVTITAMLLGAMSIMMPVKAQPQSPAYWVEPTSDTFYTAHTPVGTLFNVTIMAAAPNGTDAWSVQLGYNATQLQAVNAIYSSATGVTSVLFAGHNTTPVSAVIDNDVGSILYGEVLSGTDYINATTASVFIATFNITAAPTTGNLTSLLDPAYGIPLAETFYLLQSPTVDYPLGEVDSPNTAVMTYSYVYASSTKPIIGTVTQVPTIGNVNGSQVVTVSANVTDESGTGLRNVTLVYSKDNYATNNTVLMQLNATTLLYDGVIPGNPGGTVVKYTIRALDNAGNTAEDGYVNYTVLPEFTSIVLLLTMMATLAAAVLIVRKKRVR